MFEQDDRTAALGTTIAVGRNAPCNRPLLGARERRLQCNGKIQHRDDSASHVGDTVQHRRCSGHLGHACGSLDFANARNRNGETLPCGIDDEHAFSRCIVVEFVNRRLPRRPGWVRRRRRSRMHRADPDESRVPAFRRLRLSRDASLPEAEHASRAAPTSRDDESAARLHAGSDDAAEVPQVDVLLPLRRYRHLPPDAQAMRDGRDAGASVRS